MYEGQTLICQSIIEENWLEYLKFTKQKTQEEKELSKKRAEALEQFEGTATGSMLAEQVKSVAISDYRWYDISIQSFWNWYISNKV